MQLQQPTILSLSPTTSTIFIFSYHTMMILLTLVVLCLVASVMSSAQDTLHTVANHQKDLKISSKQTLDSFTNSLTIVAGTLSTPGYSGDGSLATSATLDFPTSTVVDTSGNIYLTDFFNNRIRFVAMSTGIISTYAGTGTAGYGGDGGLATAATLYNPSYVALKSNGDLYITSYGVIRIVAKTTGIISTVTTSSCPIGLAFDSNDNLYYTDNCSNQITKIATDGTSTIIGGTGEYGTFSGDGESAAAASFNFPNGIAIDGFNNIFIADMLNHRVRKIDATTGIVTTIAGTGTTGYSGDGGLATSAQIGYIYGLSVANNILYMADSNQHVVREVNLDTGIIGTLAGTGSAGYDTSTSQLNNPFGVYAGNGVIYISDTGNYVVRLVDVYNA
jgi:trimeric autotransporter adhesin